MTYWIDRGKNVLPNWTVAEGDDELQEELRSLEPSDPCTVYKVDESDDSDLIPVQKRMEDGSWIFYSPRPL